MFRVRLKPAATWLAAHADVAKSGMPGTACVRLDRSAPWRDRLWTDGIERGEIFGFLGSNISSASRKASSTAARASTSSGVTC